MEGFSVVCSTKKHQKAKNDFFEKIREIKPLKKIIGLGLENHSDYLTVIELTLWYIEFGLENYLKYLKGTLI